MNRIVSMSVLLASLCSGCGTLTVVLPGSDSDHGGTTVVYPDYQPVVWDEYYVDLWVEQYGYQPYFADQYVVEEVYEYYETYETYPDWYYEEVTYETQVFYDTFGYQPSFGDGWYFDGGFYVWDGY